MRKYLVIAMLLGLGCVPEVPALTDCISQRVVCADKKIEVFAETFVEKAIASEEPLPAFAAPLIDNLLEDIGDELEGISENAGALQSWQGLPEKPVEAGSNEERMNRKTLTQKAAVKNTIEAIGRKKLGLPPKPKPGPTLPNETDFPWQQVLQWGTGALLAGAAGKKTLDSRKHHRQKIALTKAIARARANGGKDSMDEALIGDHIPKDEIAATREAYYEAKKLGEV